ncbi:MAG: hypothetical protein AAF799_32255 [Myxococcota bacterium]
MTAKLARYCAYQVPDGIETPTAPAWSVPAGVVEQVAADYPRVLPQAEYTRGTDKARYASFRAQLGAAFGQGAPVIDDHDRPFVAIVDTAADADADGGWPGQPKARHGLTMGGIVSAIRCPDDAFGCDDDQRFYEQAFPGTLEDRGTVWSLHAAVLRAVERWRGLDTDTPLVLNLSVGWEWGLDDTEFLTGSREHLLAGRKGGGHPALTPAEEALFLTLTWASCQGVLSIAASGNTRGGACAQTGPMAPAAWEDMPATSFQECAGFLDATELGSVSDFHPARVVYAAGGVGADGQPIVNARPLSEPKRVLYASRVAVPMGDEQYSTPLTGTSVASASLSAIAAQYWAVHPDASAEQVIAAMAGACSSVDGGCAASNPVSLIRADSVLADHYTEPSVTLVDPSTTQSPSSGAPASTLLVLTPPSSTVSYGDRECRTHSFSGAPSASEDPWPELNPQPDSPICPTCSLHGTNGGGARVRLEVEADFRPKIPDSVAVLELHSTSGGVTRVDLDLAGQTMCALSPGTSQHLSSCDIDLSRYRHPDSSLANATLADYVATTDLRAATVSFYVAADDSTILVGNEIDVLQP